MKSYRLSTLLLTVIAVIVTLVAALPKTAASTSTPVQPESPTEIQNEIFLPMVAGGNINQNNSGQGAISSNWAIPNQYLVLWQSGSANTAAGALNYDILDLSGLVDTGLEASADAILESYRNNPRVTFVEPNYVYTSTLIPNDPLQGQQYAWALIDGYEAWDVTLGNASTIIAVVDTGVDLDHPDLVGKIVSGFDFVDGDTLADDGNGHGTHVAGTAAASTDNLRDGAGTCPNCAIMPVRALNNQGSGSLGNIAAAINFAANNGADVINLSLGASARSAILEQAINQAAANGVFLACAAGNDNSDQVFFPAGFDNCVSVASTTETDQRSSFSNFGATVEVAAPGSNILSTAPNGQTTTLNGTSMATPHVAGLAGLLSSLGLSSTEIRARLCDTADKIAGTGQFWQCGRINMLRAVTNDGATPPPTATSTPTPTPTATSTPTPPPSETPQPSDVIVDGSFEANQGWSFSSEGIRSTARPVTGQFSASLGGENNSTDFAQQAVVVPTNGRLSYAWIADGGIYGGYLGSVDPGDRLLLQIELQDGSGATFILRHPPRQQAWNRPSVDLSEFAGKSVIVRFRAETNGDTPTTFFVDDVVLDAGN